MYLAHSYLTHLLYVASVSNHFVSQTLSKCSNIFDGGVYAVD